jgi:acetyl esterase/lipase
MTAWTEHTIETAQGGRVAVRVYGKRSGAKPVALHLHGGAFTGGSVATSQRLPELIAEAGAVVVSAEYPLAPAHRFPDALEAMFDVLGGLQRCCAQWVSRRSSVFVAGEESGGNLAAALALMARDRRAALAGQILVSPMLDPVMGTCSVRSADAGAVGCPWADGWHAYLGSPEKAEHPYAAPLSARRLAGVAPALVLTAEDDPLRDECAAYAGRLHNAGVRVEHNVLPGPTGWPFALSAPANDAVLSATWAPAVVEHLKTFFANVAAPPRAAASAVSMLA